MSKIKAGQVHTAGYEVIAVEFSRGNFEILVHGENLGIEQARYLAEILNAAVGE